MTFREKDEANSFYVWKCFLINQHYYVDCFTQLIDYSFKHWGSWYLNKGPDAVVAEFSVVVLILKFSHGRERLFLPGTAGDLSDSLVESSTGDLYREFLQGRTESQKEECGYITVT